MSHTKVQDVLNVMLENDLLLISQLVRRPGADDWVERFLEWALFVVFQQCLARHVRYARFESTREAETSPMAEWCCQFFYWCLPCYPLQP